MLNAMRSASGPFVAADLEVDAVAVDRERDCRCGIRPVAQDAGDEQQRVGVVVVEVRRDDGGHLGDKIRHA